jgi:hypothetical protein
MHEVYQKQYTLYSDVKLRAKLFRAGAGVVSLMTHESSHLQTTEILGWACGGPK